jgi:hypothetical protein
MCLLPGRTSYLRLRFDKASYVLMGLGSYALRGFNTSAMFSPAGWRRS